MGGELLDEFGLVVKNVSESASVQTHKQFDVMHFTLSPKAFLPERMWTVTTMNSKMHEKTKIMQESIQMSRRET